MGQVVFLKAPEPEFDDGDGGGPGTPAHGDEGISITAAASGVVSILDLVRESILADECDMPNPLSGPARDRHGLLTLAQIGAQRILDQSYDRVRRCPLTIADLDNPSFR